MERKVSVSIYAAAFLMSLAIFVLGVFIGTLIDQANVRSVSDDVANISEKVASIQLLLLSEGNSSAFCPVYSSSLDSIDVDVERIGYRLTYLEDEKGITDPELKKKYFVVEAESYLLSQKVRSLCGDDSVLLINFYSNTACPRCKDQGMEILRARDALKGEGIDVKLFSFDPTIGSPVAEAFAFQYNVTQYPSVVINGRAYGGFNEADTLKAHIKANK